MKRDIINFKNMKPEEQQAFVDFIYKELNRHIDDILQIREDLQAAKSLGIEPRDVYINKWIEVEDEI